MWEANLFTSIVAIITAILLIFLLILKYHQKKEKEFHWDLPLAPNFGLMVNFDGVKTVNIGFYKIK